MEEEIKIKVYFKLGQKVVLKTDTDREFYIITQYVVGPRDILYNLSNKDGEYTAFFFEIESVD